MLITVDRDTFLAGETGSMVSVDGQGECYGLEPTYREIPGQPVSEWKEAGFTAIPEGSYDVTLEMSPRFRRVMPHVKDVPGFEGILLHPGNFGKDTEGCLLIGNSRPFTGMVVGIGASVTAFDALFDKMQQAVARGESIRITYGGRPPAVRADV